MLHGPSLAIIGIATIGVGIYILIKNLKKNKIHNRYEQTNNSNSFSEYQKKNKKDIIDPY